MERKMQSIPSIFIEKTNIDRKVNEFVSAKIVPIFEASMAIKSKRELRNRCAIALAIHKVDPIGPGSPMLMAA